MSYTVDEAFIRQYEAEVHHAYQRFGSRLRGTTRTKTVNATSTTFQKVGAGSAVTKSRHGEVPPMNLEHTNVECTMADYYAGDWVDKLDEFKINIDERAVISKAAGAALGRTTDTLITTALDEVTTNTSNVSQSAFAIATLTDWVVRLGERDVPIDDGMLTGVVSMSLWGKLLTIEEFSSADYIGNDLPLARAAGARMFMGVRWIPFNGLPGTASARKCYLYHQTAVGLGVNADIGTDITWHGDRASHFVNSMMSMGAKMIDNNGIEEIVLNETA